MSCAHLCIVLEVVWFRGFYGIILCALHPPSQSLEWNCRAIGGMQVWQMAWIGCAQLPSSLCRKALCWFAFPFLCRKLWIDFFPPHVSLRLQNAYLQGMPAELPCHPQAFLVVRPLLLASTSRSRYSENSWGWCPSLPQEVLDWALGLSTLSAMNLWTLLALSIFSLGLILRALAFSEFSLVEFSE